MYHRSAILLAAVIVAGGAAASAGAGEPPEREKRPERHWAFIAPARPALPAVRDRSWPQNPVDYFILARIEAAGLAPSPEAERATLLRRAALDLTGLPPAPEEMAAFLGDPDPGAYERAVQRLLASPRFGERMASRWLDAARYADTSGYQTDGERQMWRWRDWVIDAYNRNLPFDRFTIEQLAGDLLPGATLDQRIATGFNRNHRLNSEGGIIPEEYAVEYVVDRVDTTATVWLGLTLGCARCHDHKFDPVTQKEYYSFFAFFNNVPERGRALKVGNSPPAIPAPTPRDAERLAAIDRELGRAEAELRRLEPELAAAQARWEAEIAGSPLEWSHSRAIEAQFPLDGAAPGPRSAAPGAAAATCGERAPAYAPGRFGLALAPGGGGCIEAAGAGAFGYFDKFSLSAWILPEGDGGGTILARMRDDPVLEGYEVRLEGGRLKVNLVKRWLDDAIRVETVAPVAPGRWHHVLVAYDGSRMASGVRVTIDGWPAELAVDLDELNQSFAVDGPLRIGARVADGFFQGLIDDVRIYRDALDADEAAILASAERIGAIAARPAASRGRGEALKLRAAFLDRFAPEPLQAPARRAAELRAERRRFVEGLPTVMVMDEMPEPRPTFILKRGAYDQPGERVEPGVPAILPPLPAGARLDRLALAQEIVHPSNPLTARVAVNRFWQMLFGAGLVKTSEDFGVQGEAPSHPELLDWLAVEFRESGWDVKGLLRLLATSAAYRQSSRVDPARLQEDPENRLLARGPRFRLAAEVIRDQALAASGLLVERIGGPSVIPYLPAGLWKELGGADFTPGRGEDLYRRSLYTFWKRTVPPPTMIAFDAAGRETCSVREVRTNTPLQALALMNEVTFVEAARALAQRVLREAEAEPEAQIALAFRLALGREPRPAELAILTEDLAYHRERFRGDRAAALALASAGESPRAEGLDAVEVAALAAVASLILNLDEVVTKE